MRRIPIAAVFAVIIGLNAAAQAVPVTPEPGDEVNVSKLRIEPSSKEPGIIHQERPKPKRTQLPGQVGTYPPDANSTKHGYLNGRQSPEQTSNAPGQSGASPGSYAANPFGTGPLPVVPDKPRNGR